MGSDEHKLSDYTRDFSTPIRSAARFHTPTTDSGIVLPASPLPTDSGQRKELPMATGLLDYFPAALAAVANVSRVATAQHHPGKPMHWDRSTSNDHADTIIRHLVDRGGIDSDGVRHSAKVAWRALALLQEELEAEGAGAGRASTWDND